MTKLFEKLVELAERPGIITTRITSRNGMLELEIFFAPETGKPVARYELDLGVVALSDESLVLGVLEGLSQRKAPLDIIPQAEWAERIATHERARYHGSGY